MRTFALAILVTLAATLDVGAQSPYLVKDINSTTAASPLSSLPSNFFRYGSRIFFAAGSTALWSTAGTAAGTSVVFNMFTSGGLPPSGFVIVNGNLIFSARDSRGEELWMTDGTTAGTRLMADINSGSASSSPGDRIVYRGKMLVSANDGANGRELWITDGTPAGTRLFKDLTPGPSASDPRGFVLLNDLVYFAASSGIWKSDGTEAGTVLVKAGVDVGRLIVAGSRMFFGAYTQQAGSEPWVSDGTEAGTRMIADLAPGTAGSLSYSEDMAAFGDRVLFTPHLDQQGSELWITDGTAAGTRMVRDIAPGRDSGMDGGPIAVVGGTAFFAATSPTTGSELWKTDGTDAGTLLVRDIVPGSGGRSPEGLVAAGSNVFFILGSNSNTGELWISDGTSGGTRPVSTGDPKVVVASGSGLTSIDGVVYFSGANLLNGFEPWKSDGTDAGTSMIANVALDAAPSSDPRTLTAAGDYLYFNAWNGLGTYTSSGGEKHLWRTDGTPEGTLELTDGWTGGYTPVGRSLFFYRADNSLWMTNGTPEGTVPATEFAARFPSTPAIQLIIGDTIFAGASTQLWATALAPGSPAVPLGLSGFHFVELGGRVVYFSQVSFPHGTAVWSSDGTAAGSYAVVPNLGQPFAFDLKPAVMGGNVYFATQGGDVTRLRKTDGTYDGTVVVQELPAGIGAIVAAGKNLFFTSGNVVWVTDGTTAGTRSLSVSALGSLAAVGDSVVFSSSRTETGSELWISDGTAAGTRLLLDINPGASASTPSELASIAGLVYFRAISSVYGSELWVTDGTAVGTKLAADIEPGTASSVPRELVVAGERLYFSAQTRATGAELWALPLPPTPRLTINDIRVAEGNSGTTTARFTVSLSAPSTQTVSVEHVTSDGTAAAGSDYDATSGTLTFAPGETVKSIEVRVRADGAPETDEAFFVTLRNPSGATLARASALASISDDDRTADVSLALDFSSFDVAGVRVNVANAGPSVATNLQRTVTVTPSNVAASTCGICPVFPAHLPPGAPVRAFEYRWPGYQQYFTMRSTAREHDPNLSDNTLAWTVNGALALDALSLAPGSQANLWLYAFGTAASVSLESSNPAVVSVPVSVAIPSPRKPVSVAVRGVSAGTATVRAFTTDGPVGSLEIDVLAPGATRRWPGGINVFMDNGTVQFDRPMIARIYTPATAPYNGQVATGLVTINANGRELARGTLGPGTRPLVLPFYMPEIGTNAITVDYAGDTNFLPTTQTYPIAATRGMVSVTATADRVGSTVTLRVTVIGSPMASPTGAVTISGAGGVILSPAMPLTATAPDRARADITLTNLSTGPQTLFINYSGDTRYLTGGQTLRVTERRRRSTGH